MVDVVQAALLEHDRISPNTEIPWEVSFVHNEAIEGNIRALGNGNYVLYHGKGPSYFSADKVVYLRPAT